MGVWEYVGVGAGRGHRQGRGSMAAGGSRRQRRPFRPGRFARGPSALMMVNCDMSAAYISHDAGRNCGMIHHSMLHGCTHCCPVFHPTVRDRIYAVHGGNGEIRVSADAGITWRPLLNKRPPWRNPIQLLYVAPDDPDRLFVGAGEEVYVSPEGGATWKRCQGIKGKVVGIMANRAAVSSATGKKFTFIATSEGIFRSQDLSQDYELCGTGLPQGTVTSFSGGARGKVLAPVCHGRMLPGPGTVDRRRVLLQ